MLIRDEELAGAKVTVMGLGRFGGGIGVTRWLAGKGADVLVTDLADETALAPSIAQVRDLIDAGQVTLRLGGHNVSDFTTCDVVVASPAVPRPWENRFLRAAEAAGIPITTEIRLLVERLPDRKRVIGVTGTAGKSTTSAMIAHGLNAVDDRAVLGGNIGGSLLDEVSRLGEQTWVVLELSSAQLYWLGEGCGSPRAKGWSPWVAVVTNFMPNHLDWHGDVDHYRESKRNIVRWQPPSEGNLGPYSVMYESVMGWLPWNGRRGSDQIVIEDEYLDDAPTLAIPGRHNRLNALAAVNCILLISGLNPRDAISTFPGLPHRLQHAGDFAGIKVYNDSKCTTPEAARLAIEAFDDEGWGGAGNVHLIAGGYDKQIDLAPMVEAAARCAGVSTIGATGAALAEAINAAGGRAMECGTLEMAVERSAGAIARGQVLLLSPGCASWDQFTNYEERGERFIALARGHLH